MEAQIIKIDPKPKPRMTWKTAKFAKYKPYWDYSDKLKELAVKLAESGQRVVFIMPMPKSWSKKKKTERRGTPHHQTPDTDNMLKALWDSVLKQDCKLWHTEVLKLWGDVGMIVIEDRPPIDLTPYIGLCTKD